MFLLNLRVTVAETACLCCTHSVWHGDGCVFKVVIGAVEVIVGVEVRFIVDDVANAAGYGPVIVPKIHDCRTGQRIQIRCYWPACLFG